MTSPIPVEETEHSSIGSLFYFELEKKYSNMLVTDVVDKIYSWQVQDIGDIGTKADHNTDQINEITVLCQKLNKKDKKSVL